MLVQLLHIQRSWLTTGHLKLCKISELEKRFLHSCYFCLVVEGNKQFTAFRLWQLLALFWMQCKIVPSCCRPLPAPWAFCWWSWVCTPSQGSGLYRNRSVLLLHTSESLNAVSCRNVNPVSLHILALWNRDGVLVASLSLRTMQRTEIWLAQSFIIPCESNLRGKNFRLVVNSWIYYFFPLHLSVLYCLNTSASKQKSKHLMLSECEFFSFPLCVSGTAWAAHQWHLALIEVSWPSLFPLELSQLSPYHICDFIVLFGS